MPLLVEARRDRKLNRLVKAAEVRRLGRLERLFRAGDPAGDVFLVRSGFLRLVEPATGTCPERTVGVAGPWEILGEEAMAEGRVRRYDCVAGEKTTYQALDGAAVFHVIKTTRRTFAALLDGLARDLERARHLTAGSAGPSARARLAHVLVDLGRRWGREEGDGVLIPHHVTHQVLADLGGVHRSTVTTTLNDWIYEGILAQAGRGILLTRPDRLASLAGSGGAREKTGETRHTR